MSVINKMLQDLAKRQAQPESAASPSAAPVGQDVLSSPAEKAAPLTEATTAVASPYLATPATASRHLKLPVWGGGLVLILLGFWLFSFFKPEVSESEVSESSASAPATFAITATPAKSLAPADEVSAIPAPAAQRSDKAEARVPAAAQSLINPRADALPETATVPEPIALSVSVTATEAVALPETATVPEPIALSVSATAAEIIAIPEPLTATKPLLVAESDRAATPVMVAAAATAAEPVPAAPVVQQLQIEALPQQALARQMEQAAAAVAQQQWTEALYLLTTEAAVADYPPLFALKAAVLQQLQQWSAALALYQQLLVLEPLQPGWNLAAGISAQQLQQSALAQQYFQTAWLGRQQLPQASQQFLQQQLNQMK